MISQTYDPEADAMYMRFVPDGIRIEETREVAPGVNVDLDANGRLVGIEVLHVRLRQQQAAATAAAE